MNDADPPRHSTEPRHSRRRSRAARLAWRRIDPMFAATLINHIAPPESTKTQVYPANGDVRPGIIVDVRA